MHYRKEYRAVRIREITDDERRSRLKDAGLQFATLYRSNGDKFPHGVAEGSLPHDFEIFGSTQPKIGSLIAITIGPVDGDDPDYP